MSITPRIPAFIDRDREKRALQFNLGNTGSNGIDVAWWRAMDSSGLAINMTGFNLGVGSADFVGLLDNDPNFKLRFNWSLFAGGMCSLDDEPVWEGSTFWGPKTSRNGLLVQVTGRASEEWLLKVAIEDPGFEFTLTASLSWRLPTEPIIAGPFLSTGAFVG